MKETLHRLAITLIVVGLIITNCWQYTHRCTHTTTHRDTLKITHIDTIHYQMPLPVDSAIIRYDKVRVAVTTTKSPTHPDTSHLDPQIPRHTPTTHDPTDTLEIELPITQVVYEDSTYKAWVSGYNPRLDSLKTYNKTNTYLITHTTLSKPKRWNISVGIGLGINRHGDLQPYLGLHAGYTLFSR